MPRPPGPAADARARSEGRRVDLHTHTHFSDGALAPEELMARAVERQLGTLAITDHDSVEAIAPARAWLSARAATPFELVPGVELSSAIGDLDLHILGYFVDPEQAGMLERLAQFRAERLERARSILARLEALGATLDLRDVLGLAGPGVVGRPHVARALIQAGHSDSMEDAFRRYLGTQGAAFVPRPAFMPERAIEIIHGAGGVSVLAHPGAALSVAVIERLVAAGMRGIEVWHPQHGVATVRRYRELSRRLGLLETGGSDFHEPGRGVELGGMPVPPAAVARLREAAGVAG